MAAHHDSFTLIARRMRKAAAQAPKPDEALSIEDMLRNIDATITRRRAA